MRRSYLPWSIAAIALLVPAWWLAYRYTTFIVNPIEVVEVLPAFLADWETWSNIAITVVRVALGLAGGVVLGIVIAFAMDQSELGRSVFGVYVTIALRTPSAIAAILALAIFKRSELGYVAVVIFITFPFMTIGLLDGLKTAHRELNEMAQIYRLGTWKHIRHVLIPFLAPFLFSGFRNAYALAWKVIVVAEIFGAATEGFGAEFNHAWQYFLMTDVHLWLLVFVALVLFFEYGVMRVIERRVFRWRDAGR